MDTDRRRRRMPRALLVGLGPAVGAAVGVLTNVLTQSWSWWLFGSLVVLVALASVLVVVAEPALRALGWPDSHSGPTDAIARTPVGHAPVWLDVPPRNRIFTGRGDLLEGLHGLVLRGRGVAALVPQALYGLGGVGKTHLAIEYAVRHRDEYDLVAWIPAEQTALLHSAFLRLAARMGIAESEDISRTVDSVRDRLRRGEPFRRWLLIFDNAPDASAIRAYLPHTNHPHSVGHVLITSRDRYWSGIADLTEVDVLQRSESVALILRHVPSAPARDADLLAARLGDLPLALEQAAAWVETSGGSIADYLRLLEDRPGDLLSANRPSDYPLPVALVWGTALRELADIDPAAAQLLRLCSYFGPEPIDRNLLRFGSAVGLPPSLGETLGDPLRLGRTVASIGRRSLAKLDAERGTIQLHRLVQSYLRSIQPPDEAEVMRQGAQRILAGASAAVEGNDSVEALAVRDAILPHLTVTGCLSGPRPEVRELVIDQVHHLWWRGDAAESQRIGVEALDEWAGRLGADHPDVISMRVGLARAARTLGDTAGAYALDEQSVGLALRTFGRDHPVHLQAATNFGADLRISGEYQRALDLDELSYRVRTRHDGVSDPRTLYAANNVAISLRMLGRFEEAAALDRETVRRRADLGYVDVLHSRMALAADEFYLGHYSEALDLTSTTVHQIAQQLGPDHTRVLLWSRVHLLALQGNGRMNSARAFGRDLLLRSRRLNGDDHPQTLLLILSQSNVERPADTGAAHRLAREALSGYEKLFGRHHPNAAAAMVTCAAAARANGQVRAALALDEEATASLKALLGDDHWVTLCGRASLATDRALAGDYRAARQISEDTYHRTREHRGPHHPYTISCALNLATDCESTGDGAEARQLRRSIGRPRSARTGAGVVWRRRARAELDVDLPDT